MSRKKPKSSSDQDESKTSIPAVEARGNPIAAATAADEKLGDKTGVFIITHAGSVQYQYLGDGCLFEVAKTFYLDQEACSFQFKKSKSRHAFEETSGLGNIKWMKDFQDVHFDKLHYLHCIHDDNDDE